MRKQLISFAQVVKFL